MNQAFKGLSWQQREKYAQLLQQFNKGVITNQACQKELNLDIGQTAQLLFALEKRGWLQRVKRGVYVPIPIDTLPGEALLEDPWDIVNALYEPCYVGGWSALQHYDITEQIFNATLVVTTKKIRNINQDFNGIHFHLKKVSAKLMFGLKSTWQGSEQIKFSDLEKTLLDILLYPEIGGGIRHVMHVFSNYINSKEANLDKLIEYASIINKGVLYKRLGFVLEVLKVDNKYIDICIARISKGILYLDPNIKTKKLNTKWGLWVPRL